MNRYPSPHHNEALAPAQPTLLIDPTRVDAAPIRIALPRVHLAGSNAHYDAHLEVGRHGLSLFLAPTAQFPALDIDGTPEQLAQLAHALTSALTA
ncbi:MAG TPA: hypothetical protein VFB07_13010 [Vicinamibacterales bacterium]|nr:hypothetical protein [Vicinamibacterales bacterium]